MEIVPGPHQGFWIIDKSPSGDKVVVWCYSKERAEERLKEIQCLTSTKQ